MRIEDEIPMGETMERFQAAVRDTAYFLWEQAGRPDGCADAFWQKALELKIRERVADQFLRMDPPAED